jgi:acetone carboxylase gamma subunit
MWKSRFSESGLHELYDAVDWYDEQSLGLGDKFLVAVNEMKLVIETSPFLFAAKERNYRAALLNDFPYLIIYLVDEVESELLITSIFHTSRNPKKKFKK